MALSMTMGAFILILATIGGVVIFIPIMLNILELAPYMYANAKIRAMESGLLKKDKIKNLLDAKDAIECMSTLENTDYGPYVSKITDPITPQKIESSLNQNLVDICTKLVGTAPDELAEVLNERLKLWDAHNIKFIFRAVFENIPVEERDAYLIRLGSLKPSTLKALVESKTIEEVVSELDSTEYGQVVSAALPEFKKDNNLLPLELAIDKYVMERTYKKVAVASSTNLQVARELIGTDADIRNLKTIARGIVGKVDPKDLEKYLVDVNHHISSDVLKNLLRISDLDEAVTYLDKTPYATIISEAVSAYKQTNSLYDLEKALDGYYRKLAKRLSIISPLGAGPALNLLVGKEADVRTLNMIIKFKSEPSMKADVGALVS